MTKWVNSYKKLKVEVEIMFKNILFVCTGNICRSPMGEELLRQFLAESKPDVKISSAGIGALVNKSAASEVRELMAKKGFDVAPHRGRQITPEIALAADLILTMEQHHNQYVEKLCPSAKGRTFLLGKWNEEDDEIPDPYRMPIQVYANVLELIEQGCRDWVKRLF
jgi:protein-tyrosine phosphatase